MSKKNIWCRMLGHRYQMALGGFRCARCGHFREAAWNKIPPPPKPPKPVEKRTDYEELWKNSKSVTDIFQSMRLALWGLSTDTCDVMYVGGKYIILDNPPPSASRTGESSAAPMVTGPTHCARSEMYHYAARNI